MDVDQSRRLRIFGGAILVAMCFAFVGLIGRLVYLHTFDSRKLTRYVRSQQIGYTILPGRRGCVVDRHGRMLAGTQNKPSVMADPSMMGDIGTVAERLAPVVGLDEGVLLGVFRKNQHRRFCRVRRFVEPVEADAVRALSIAGVFVRDEPQRIYPSGQPVGPVVGFVGFEGRGLEGIEKQFDGHLGAKDGKSAAVYDGRRSRRPIWLRDDLSCPPKDGGHVMLTIDLVVQSIVYEEVRDAAESFGARYAVGIVMDPNNGDVLAMAQFPSYESSFFAEVNPGVRRNLAITDAIEPGSTFKPFVASGALAGGVIDPGEMIDCRNGVHYFGGQRIRDTKPKGALDFVGILTYSSNIGMGFVGERMGNEMIHDIVRSFGFGRRTGVGFAGESPGLVRSLDTWTSYSTHSVPIGQELAVTPLQLVTGFAAIANGGTLLRPRLVRGRMDSSGDAVEMWTDPEPVRRVLPEAVARFMRERALVQVVKEGGGRRSALDDWQVFGKTGTAEVAYDDRAGYEPDAYMGAYLGGAPASDPALVAVVMVYRPVKKLGYYGSKVAAPAVGQILKRSLSYLQIPADVPADVPAGDESEWPAA